MDKPARSWWAFCDACGSTFLDGHRAAGYVVLSRQLAAHGWQQLPYLATYCPVHRLND